MKNSPGNMGNSLMTRWMSLIPVYIYLMVVFLLVFILKRNGNRLAAPDDSDELIYHNTAAVF